VESEGRIAVLILAHKNSTQVARLIHSLKHPKVDCYLHFDKKMPITHAEMQSLGGAVIAERISCFLDDWSLCQAALLLLQESRKIFQYKYYILLSGQDYPIKPIGNLVNFLEKNYPKPFIDMTPYSVNNWIAYKFWTTKFHHDFKVVIRDMQSVVKHRIPGTNRMADLCQKLSSKFRPTAFELLSSLGVNIYGGSAWWTLPDLAVEEIFKDMEAHPNITDAFKWSFTPEETFFQTMTMRTSVAHFVDVNPVDERAQNCLTYAHFVSPTKGASCHPHILEENDWIWLQQRPEYFARKFDMNCSPKVFDIIDKTLE